MNAAQQQAEIANERPWEILGKTKAEWDAMPVNQHAHGENPSDSPALTPAEKTRKPRSDKGKPKPKKEEPEHPGVLTLNQAQEIYRLSGLVEDAKQNFAAANDFLAKAKNDFHEYINSLTAK